VGKHSIFYCTDPEM